MSRYIQKLNRLTSEAWQNQSNQIQQWLNGDAIHGAAAAIEALKQSFKLPRVRQKDWQYMIPNLVVLFVMSLAFLLLHGLIILTCHLIGLTGWTITSPTLFTTTRLVIWIQIGVWSSLLSNVFYNSAEDCFYSRLNQVDHQGLIEVHRWEENWSFLARTWSSLKRNIKYDTLFSPTIRK
jgi:hypothetical protein